MDKNQTKFVLDEKDMATAWYNVVADLPEPLPPPDPGSSREAEGVGVVQLG